MTDSYFDLTLPTEVERAKKRAAWEREAREAALKIFGPEVRQLEDKIAENKAIQAEMFDDATAHAQSVGKKWRTFGYDEQKQFDWRQEEIDKANRELHSLFARALPGRGFD